MLTELDKTNLYRLAKAATPGPWLDLTKIYHERMVDYNKKTRRWWHGSRNNSLPLILIARDKAHPGGISYHTGNIPKDVDVHDMECVIRLFWSSIKKTLYRGIHEGFMLPNDSAYVAAANPKIVMELIDENRHLLELIDAYRNEHQASQDRGQGHPEADEGPSANTPRIQGHS